MCSTKDLTWFVPKGVLLHVFYNLINNSLYWIDVRRKRAQSDSTYAYPGTDTIAIEEYGVDGIVVYDTGTGVSKSMEDILCITKRKPGSICHFEAYRFRIKVTAKIGAGL